MASVSIQQDLAKPVNLAEASIANPIKNLFKTLSGILGLEIAMGGHKQLTGSK